VSFCNQNQFRMDRSPEDVRILVGQFLQSKKEDMYGGKDQYKRMISGGKLYLACRKQTSFADFFPL